MDNEEVFAITKRFNEAFAFDEPCLIEGGDGMPVRMMGASMTISRRRAPGWINAPWAPWGDCNKTDIITVPKTFEGINVNFYQSRVKPLLPQEIAQRHFGDRFMGGKMGTIEDGDGRLVTVNGLMLSIHGPPEVAAAMGVQPGEIAMCAWFIPVVDTSMYDRAHVVYPKRFEDVNIYYEEGSIVVAAEGLTKT